MIWTRKGLLTVWLSAGICFAFQQNLTCSPNHNPALAELRGINLLPSDSVENTYVLPYAQGASYELLQGYNGPYGHTGRAEFAYDFKMPIGSSVIAARGGEVVKVVEKNSDSTRVPGEENVVVIKHSDGTFGRYYHLTKEGALVAIGDNVKQGDKIALSGDSGASAGAHLHFDVTKECFEWGCQTIPIRFVNAKENPLKQGETYQALEITTNSSAPRKSP
jgi:murein DD-endopeptidase MepM/ murein hydrolase activator NlpD